jgi:hypothetical protein
MKWTGIEGDTRRKRTELDMKLMSEGKMFGIGQSKHGQSRTWPRAIPNIYPIRHVKIEEMYSNSQDLKGSMKVSTSCIVPCVRSDQ